MIGLIKLAKKELGYNQNSTIIYEKIRDIIIKQNKKLKDSIISENSNL